MVLIDEKREWDVSLSSSIRLNRTYNILHIIIMHIIHKAVQVTHTHTHIIYLNPKNIHSKHHLVVVVTKKIFIHTFWPQDFSSFVFFVFFLSTSSVQKNSIILVCDVLATTITTTTSISISTTTGK